MSMRIETALISCKGGRKYNEDNVRCQNNGDVCAVIAADGLGGHGGGHIASEVAANCIIDSFMKKPKIDRGYISQLFTGANTEVLNAQTASQQMKSTGVALFIKDDAVIWGHAGDSRLYHFKDGKIIFQTVDHSVSQLAVYSGEITKDQIRHHEDRNKITKAFGAAENLKPEISEIYGIKDGFHSFLLCTDGFWENIYEDEMEIELEKSTTPDQWLSLLVQRLEERAPEDVDNYSAAAVFIQKEK